MYKVYFNRNLVLFPAQAPTDGTRTWVDPDPQTLRKVVADCFDKGKAKIAFLSTTGEDLKKIFDSFFRHIPAGGGIVRHEPSGRILMIRRQGRWDLPKGWREAGETDRENALREVREETGTEGLSIVAPVGITRHAYLLEGQWAIKHTAWFAMQTRQNTTCPQREEGIERVEWLDRRGVEQALNDTFPNIREILETYLALYPLP